MDKIDWSKYVDVIYALHYEPFSDRLPKFESELDKIDILHSPLFKYWLSKEDPSLFTKIDQMNPSHVDYHNFRRKVAVNITFNYYYLLQQLKKDGYERVLIIEDDMLFRDRELLHATMEHLPPDWDYIPFDRLYTEKYEHYLASCEPYSLWFYQNYTGGYWGTGFTLWSKEAIKTAVDVLDDEFVPSDYILINRDDPRLDHLRRYIPTRLLVYQDGQLHNYYPKYY